MRRGQRLESFPDPGTQTAPVPLGAMFGMLLGIALFGVVVSAATGEAMDRAYFAPPREARDRVLLAFAEIPRCTVCYSSVLGAVEPTVALGNDVTFVDLRSGPPLVRAGQSVAIRVRPRSREGDYVVGLVRVDLGDGATATYRRIFGDVSLNHVYAQPGDYEVHAWVKASAAEPAEARINVHVVP